MRKFIQSLQRRLHQLYQDGKKRAEEIKEIKEKVQK